MTGHSGDFLHRLTALFVDSKLVPLLVVFALLLGVAAVVATPSEEEPQIVVPMIDVEVAMPGASPREMELRVVGPMEKLLWEIPGVEYVYSTAMEGQALSVVRFAVGHDPEAALITTYAKLYQHLDWIPPGCSMPLIKPKSIDDVPILAVTFTSPQRTPLELRHLALEAAEVVRRIPGVAEVSVLGGQQRGITVEPDPEKLRQLGLDLPAVVERLAAQNVAEVRRGLVREGVDHPVRLWSGLASAEEVRRTVVAVHDGAPVFLEDVANVRDGALEPQHAVFCAAGPAKDSKGIALPQGMLTPAVTLTVAKRPGESAIHISQAAQERIHALQGIVLPADVTTIISRDFGETARHKTDELLFHLALAAASVGLIVALFLGVRASFVVMIAVPVTLAITLATYWLLGYTLNRVTLFALIFCIGILVDDPIVDVENIVRHLRLPESRTKGLTAIIVDAVSEVRGPLILATFTVVAAIMPMAFVRGLMGPYMRPMPIGASIAMLLSMAVAFGITPWLAKRFLGQEHHQEESGGRLTALYTGFMRRLIHNPRDRALFLAFVAILLLLALAMFPLRLVLVKMLPFDNKSELEIVIDMPDGTSLEATMAAAEAIAREVLADPAVADIQIYAGTAAPFTFNGLVRHYYGRRLPHEAEIQVNLAPRSQRKDPSHAIAQRLREAIAPVAARFSAATKTVEMPPGPPVLQTLVAEIYGPTAEGRLAVARQVRDILESTPNVVDVDWYVTDPHPELRVDLLPDKAMALGVAPPRVQQTLATALSGTTVGLIHDPVSREDVPLVVRLPQQLRSAPEHLAHLGITGSQGIISLGEIATVSLAPAPAVIYHKNMLSVVYVTADMAGGEESPVYGILRVGRALDELAAQGQGAWQTPGDTRPLPRLFTRMPVSDTEYILKWDGEWQITYEVFRDMGLAFAAVVVLIALLVVGWFGSYTTPLAIMAPIPLSLIGIIPAHALAGAFFTATSMIGFIAGAGIVVRNSIILVDFIELRRSLGVPLAEAVVEAGALRFRPMVLTALSVVAGAFVILFDPIFQGLAISLMAGEVAATLFSRLVVPTLYYLDQRRSNAEAQPNPSIETPNAT